MVAFGNMLDFIHGHSSPGKHLIVLLRINNGDVCVTTGLQVGIGGMKRAEEMLDGIEVKRLLKIGMVGLGYIERLKLDS